MHTPFKDSDVLGRFVAPVVIPETALQRDRFQELLGAYERIAELDAMLHECREFLEGQVDVVDGDYGVPRPNRAMILVSLIDEALHGE